VSGTPLGVQRRNVKGRDCLHVADENAFTIGGGMERKRRRVIVYYSGEPREELDAAMQACPGFHASGYDFPDNRRELVFDTLNDEEMFAILSGMPDDAVVGISMVMEAGE